MKLLASWRLVPALFLVIALGSTAPSGQSKAPASTRAVGPVVAKIRIDLFSDYQCPACKGLHESTINRVRDEYALKGKVRLVHHDFPLPQHKFARRAAILASAADKLGKFDQVSDALFQQQDAWSVNGKVDEAVDSALTPEEQKRIREIAKDPAIEKAIDADVALGQRMMVSQTPTMIVTTNSQPTPVVGVVTFPIFSRYLESLLAK